MENRMGETRFEKVLYVHHKRWGLSRNINGKEAERGQETWVFYNKHLIEQGVCRKRMNLHMQRYLPRFWWYRKCITFWHVEIYLQSIDKGKSTEYPSTDLPHMREESRGGTKSVRETEGRNQRKTGGTDLETTLHGTGNQGRGISSLVSRGLVWIFNHVHTCIHY